jgi:hypothetical protein
MPAIKLKHFHAPTRVEREKMARETGLVCVQCHSKVAVLGAMDNQNSTVWCDNCAIDNYQVSEGFNTRQAAKAHRRRMFDVTYLLAEVLLDQYLAWHKLASEEDLSNREKEVLFETSYELNNMVPLPKKIELQNTLDQAKIERYYTRLISQWLRFPRERLDV